MTAVPHTLATARSRIESLDALRALAALSVFYSHSWPRGITSGMPDALFEAVRLWIFANGQTGVLLFFIISGFVVPWSLITYPNGHLRRFLVSRIFRLYPSYWLSLLLVVALGAGSVPLTTLIINVTMLQRFVGQPDVIGVYWTLSVELMFYGLIAALFVLGLTRRACYIGWIVAASAALVLAGATVRRLTGLPVPAGLGLYFLLMLFGVWMRLAMPPPARQMPATAALLALIATCCWLLYFPEAYGRSWLAHFAGFAIAVLAFVLLWNRPWLGWRPLVWSGVVSYPIYLFHQPLTELVTRVWPDGPPLARFSAIVLATLALSGLVHAAAEKPLVRLGRAIADCWVRRG